MVLHTLSRPLHTGAARCCVSGYGAFGPLRGQERRRHRLRLVDALVPFDQRVDRALQAVLARGTFSQPQRQWLQKIAAQTKANQVVDRAALDDPDQVFKREGGGFTRLDRLFNGKLQEVLDSFQDHLWPAVG